MELKAGYQQTEIGVIPEEWSVARVTEIAEIKTGKKNTDDKIDDGLYPFFVRSQKVERINSFACDEEAVLTAGDGVGVGKVFHYVNGKFDFHQRVYKISHFNGVNGKFFFEYFKQNFLSEAVKYTAKSSVDSVRMDMIARMLIPVPPLPEQQSIAAALNNADALLGALDALVAKKRNIKQGAMQELLTGKKRLAGFSGEWEERTLGEIVDKFTNGGTPPTQQQEFWQGNIPWITGADVIDQKVSDIRRFITKEAVKHSTTNVVNKGNLLVVTRTGVGKLAIAPFDVAISQDFTGICVRSDLVITDYLFRYLDYNAKELRSLIQGTSILGITRDRLASLTMQLPSIGEQHIIAEILGDLDAEIEGLERKRAKYQMVKQGMMQELLTGKTRLVGAL